MRKYILFDLDGTLTDPAEGITNSVAYALLKFGIAVSDKRELYRFIGPPLLTSFIEYYGFAEPDAKLALGYYREYFRPKGIFENRVYDGIPELLDGLKRAGALLIVATSKPEEFTVEILEHFGLDGYFTAVCGNTLDEKRPTKAGVIAYAKSLFPDMSGENSVMVGDRVYDVEGASECGLPTVGVLYGYGSADELDGAYATAGSVGELFTILSEL